MNIKNFKIPKIDVKATGENIRRLRKESGLQAKDVSNLLELSDPGAVFHWECGMGKPNSNNLVALSRIFGVKIDDILIIKED